MPVKDFAMCVPHWQLDRASRKGSSTIVVEKLSLHALGGLPKTPLRLYNLQCSNLSWKKTFQTSNHVGVPESCFGNSLLFASAFLLALLVSLGTLPRRGDRTGPPKNGRLFDRRARIQDPTTRLPRRYVSSARKHILSTAEEAPVVVRWVLQRNAQNWWVLGGRYISLCQKVVLFFSWGWSVCLRIDVFFQVGCKGNGVAWKREKCFHAGYSFSWEGHKMMHTTHKNLNKSNPKRKASKNNFKKKHVHV